MLLAWEDVEEHHQNVHCGSGAALFMRWFNWFYGILYSL